MPLSLRAVIETLAGDREALDADHVAGQTDHDRMQGHPSCPAGGVPVGGGGDPSLAGRGDPAAHRGAGPTDGRRYMTSARVENLERDAEQRHGSAQAMHKQPPAADKTSQTACCAGQEVGPRERKLSTGHM